MSPPQNLTNQQEVESSYANNDEINLIDFIKTLGEEKWLLLGLPFICACVAAFISLNLTPMYTAKATFVLPDRQPSSASAILDQYGGGLGGVIGSLSKSTIDMYVALMQSDTVQDVIIAEFALKQRYQAKTQEDTRKTLKSLVKITSDKKSGLLTIEAQDQSPDVAAKLANAFLKPLRAVLDRISLEEAHLRRDFFAQQIVVIAQRPFRDPLVQSSLINSMIKQYEAARIDEARKSQILFPVDVAKSPESRSSPKRVQFVLTVGSVAFFLSLLLVFIKKALLRAHTDPASSQKLAMLKKAWKLRS